MRVTDNEYTDPAVQEPKVTDSPAEIWLVYGDIEHDDTHHECCASGEVTWCEDAQFAADVRYVRADMAEAKILALTLAEEGAKEAFGHVVQQEHDAEAECKRLRQLLEDAHASIQRMSRLRGA